MNTSTRKTPSNKSPATHKGGKAPRDPRRLREILAAEDVGTSNHQIDPWRGQIMQIGWDYCV